ncbi:MAG: ribosome-binding factor A [Candidatus Yonathbacteria bacterium]|nr:ribosome-binding factor A [Candidatus Yonathbacteria bacterium]
MEHSKEKLRGVIMAIAGEYLSREADRSSLITVTGCTIPDNMRSATVLISVLPEHRSAAALEFAQRKLPEFRAYVASHARLKYVPFFSFALDVGEKNRQALDEVMRNDPRIKSHDSTTKNSETDIDTKIDEEDEGDL